MSVSALGHIGPFETAPLAPVRAAHRVATGRTILVRPATSVDPADTRRTDTVRPRQTPVEGPYRGTAHQSNTDGDSATFASRLGSLSQSEQTELTKLRERNEEVRTHEHAHLAAAGGLAKGGASYEYKTGPDGERYAVGGHVSIDSSPGATPEETIARAQQIKRAALAPANPSGQDRAVAAKAARMETEARRTLAASERTSSPSSSSSASWSPVGLDLIA